ncbi:MAG: methyltransferase domain-containing protein [Terriglobia bacterium]
MRPSPAPKPETLSYNPIELEFKFASEAPVAAMVAHCCDLLRVRLNVHAPSGIMVGCGTGDEVVYARRVFHTSRVFECDVEAQFSRRARAEGCVLLSDALRLPFAADTFDFATAFHSLEHVSNARVALEEIARVLQPGAWLYAGVPNRSRVLGYLGSFDATLWQKISWNLADWRARFSGTFRNETGAHAGFERGELLSLLDKQFGEVRLLTEEFLRFKYVGRLPAPALDLLLSPL